MLDIWERMPEGSATHALKAASVPEEVAAGLLLDIGQLMSTLSLTSAREDLWRVLE